jgi:hypothetical protein
LPKGRIESCTKGKNFNAGDDKADFIVDHGMPDFLDTHVGDNATIEFADEFRKAAFIHKAKMITDRSFAECDSMVQKTAGYHPRAYRFHRVAENFQDKEGLPFYVLRHG